MASGLSSVSALAAGLFTLLFALVLLEEQYHWVLKLRLMAGRVAEPTAKLQGLDWEEPEQPAALLERQLATAPNPAASSKLHTALARVYEAANQPEVALQHLEAARDSALEATKTAAPPLKLGEAIVWAGQEAEDLALARMDLVKAYLERGRTSDAKTCLQPQLEAMVGLEPMHVAALQCLDGQIMFEEGNYKLALHVYKFARQRLERLGTRDLPAVEELARVHRGMAQVHLRLGSPTEALEHARQGLSLLGVDLAALRRSSAPLAPELAAETHMLASAALKASGNSGGQEVTKIRESIQQLEGGTSLPAAA